MRFYFPTQNFENISLTISSLTARPSSSDIAPRARSMSLDAASWEKPSSIASAAAERKSMHLVSAACCLALEITAS